MRKIDIRLLIMLSALPLLLTTCNMADESTATKITPTLDYDFIGTIVVQVVQDVNVQTTQTAAAITPSTNTPTSTPTYTEFIYPFTVTFPVFATSPGCQYSNNIVVPLSRGAVYCVSSYSNSTITSVDKKGHTCTFIGRKNVTISFGYRMDLPQLIGTDDYILKCDYSPISVKIILYR